MKRMLVNFFSVLAICLGSFVLVQPAQTTFAHCGATCSEAGCGGGAYMCGTVVWHNGAGINCGYRGGGGGGIEPEEPQN